jgi:hypothetical protein
MCLRLLIPKANRRRNDPVFNHPNHKPLYTAEELSKSSPLHAEHTPIQAPSLTSPQIPCWPRRRSAGPEDHKKIHAKTKTKTSREVDWTQPENIAGNHELLDVAGPGKDSAKTSDMSNINGMRSSV